MKILVIGKGGREHALVHAFSRSKRVKQIFAAPGNPGIAQLATCVNIADDNVSALLSFAKQEGINLTVVGGEGPLAAGIVDAFQASGMTIFGPTQAAAQVETSKEFAKKIMVKYGIPTAAYQSFTNYEEAVGYVEKQGVPIVIKEDGLKAGKGVTVAHSIQEAIAALQTAFSQGDNRVVIEEFLSGFEFSLICFVCDDIVIPMEIAQDHKCAYDDDQGPNTGGMGVYSPVHTITETIKTEAMERVMKPMARAMVKEGYPFCGFLYGGLILTEHGVKTIEFNARFGDPEAEVILPRLKTDLCDVIENLLHHQKTELEWDSDTVLGVVMASQGYPSSYQSGALIEGYEQLQDSLYHMGTKLQDDKLFTAGGRVLLVLGKAPSLQTAYQQAYDNVAKIKCDALFYRHDIGKKDH